MQNVVIPIILDANLDIYIEKTKYFCQYFMS
jgi:hypothetical protein